MVPIAKFDRNVAAEGWAADANIDRDVENLACELLGIDESSKEGGELFSGYKSVEQIVATLDAGSVLQVVDTQQEWYEVLLTSANNVISGANRPIISAGPM